MEFPKTLGACVDKLYEMREKRLKLAAEVEKMQGQEYELREHILTMMNEQDMEKATGKLASASMKPTIVARVQDWDVFYEYIRKNKAFFLLQRRVNDSAYREILENNKTVPGVESARVVGLNLNKR